MIKIKIVFLFFVVLLSNCSNKECKDLYMLDRIQIFNYRLQDAQNILITGYNNNTTDSYSITSIEAIDSSGYKHDVYLDKNINPDYNYDVYFADLDSHCKITDIQVLETKCKDGLFSDDYEYAFDGYYVKGTHFSCQVLKAGP